MDSDEVLRSSCFVRWGGRGLYAARSVHSTRFSAGRTGTSVLSRVKSTVAVCHVMNSLPF